MAGWRTTAENPLLRNGCLCTKDRRHAATHRLWEAARFYAGNAYRIWRQISKTKLFQNAMYLKTGLLFNRKRLPSSNLFAAIAARFSVFHLRGCGCGRSTDRVPFSAAWKACHLQRACCGSTSRRLRFQTPGCFDCCCRARHCLVYYYRLVLT